MSKHDNGLKAMQAYWKKRQLAKAKRLSRGRPKWKDELQMNKEQYEAYIDRFLHMDDEDHEASLDQAKLAKDMLALKLKHENGESNPLMEES